MTNDEMLKIAGRAKNADELLRLAKENGVEISVEDAADLFAQLHKAGELSDEELDNVSGGCNGEKVEETHKYNKGDKVRFRAKSGDAKTLYGIIYWFMGYTQNDEEKYDIIRTDETFTIEKEWYHLIPESQIKPA